MKFSRLVLIIAAIIVGVWLLGIIFRVAAWLINGLLYVAAVVLIVWLIAKFIEQKKTTRS